MKKYLILLMVLMAQSSFAQILKKPVQTKGVFVNTKEVKTKKASNGEHWADRLVREYDEEQELQRLVIHELRHYISSQTSLDECEFCSEEMDDTEYSIYEKIDQQPSFPGGVEALQLWIFKNLRYPEAAQQLGVQGIVIVQFMVNIDGSICDLKVLKSVTRELDNEAVRIIATMPRWEPGVHEEEKVRVRYALPIVFSLE